MVNYDNIPAELMALNQWVVWKFVQKEDRMTKLPYQINGVEADSTNPETWTSFKEACAASVNFDGIGFVFTEESGIVGVDFDHVVVDGQWKKTTQDEVFSFKSYSEVSPSGNGIHVYVFAEKPGDKCKKALSDGTEREMYSKGRFFTVTGEHIEGTPTSVKNAQGAVTKLYNVWFAEQKKKNTSNTGKSPDMEDDQILGICRGAKNADKFSKLFNKGDLTDYNNDASAADQALCNILAFYTQKPEQIDRLFRQSALMRDKWDREDYRNRTIEAALNAQSDVFTGANDKKKNAPEKISVPFDVVAKDIMEHKHLFTMRDTGEIYLYANGIYTCDGSEAILGTLARKLYDGYYAAYWAATNPDFPIGHIPQATTRQVSEVLAYIKAFSHVRREEIDDNPEYKKLICLENGVFNFETLEFIQHDPKYKLTRRIPITYDQKATCPNIINFMNDVVNEEDAQVLFEFIGYCLIPDTRFTQGIMLQGEGANGKSVLLTLMRHFIGESNLAAVEMQQLCEDKFSLAQLYGKLANVYPDMSDEEIKGSGKFKAVTSGDMLEAQRKFGQPFHFRNYSRQIYSVNKVPYPKDQTFAYFRRLILINFPWTFVPEPKAGTNEKKEDKNIIDKITTQNELSGFFNLVVACAKHMIEKGKYSYATTVEEVTEQYMLKADPARAFIERYTELSEYNTPKSDMYEAYARWAAVKRVQPMSQIRFVKKLKSMGVTDGRPRDDGGAKQNVWENISLTEGFDKDIPQLRGASKLSQFETVRKPDEASFWKKYTELAI